MTRIAVDLPEEIAKRLQAAWRNVPRGALEAVALEGYRDGTLARDEVGHLLGLSFWETEAFLKERKRTLLTRKRTLNKIGVISTAPGLDDVLIPAAVRREFEAHAAPAPIRRWMAAGATSLETRLVSDVSVDLKPLGAGEREAIRLAEVTQTADQYSLTRRRRAESHAIADSSCRNAGRARPRRAPGPAQSSSRPRSAGADNVSRITSPPSPRPRTTLGPTVLTPSSAAKEDRHDAGAAGRTQPQPGEPPHRRTRSCRSLARLRGF